jgi:hypothetical protein
MTPPPVVVSVDLLEVFIATAVVSPNVRAHPLVHARRVKRQREAVALAVWGAFRHPRRPGFAWTVTNPTMPKTLTLTAHTARPLDSDNLAMALKGCRDGCIDAGLVQDDAEAARHAWRYAQVVDGRRGVTLRVECRPSPGPIGTEAS